jgi:hypothetical protein
MSTRHSSRAWRIVGWIKHIQKWLDIELGRLETVSDSWPIVDIVLGGNK